VNPRRRPVAPNPAPAVDRLLALDTAVLPVHPQRMTLRQLLSVVEIRTKVISASTYTLATLYTLSSGRDVVWAVAALLAVAVLCVDMGTTAFNTFFDYVRGVDTPLSTVEPGKVLVHEGVAPGHALVISFALYAVGAGAGVLVAALTTWWIVPAGIASMAVGFLYNGGPLPISRTPLGEVFAGGFLGTVLFLVVYAVHTGTVTASALVASVPSTLIIACVLTVNNTCDIEGDRFAGRRTLSIVLGRPAASVLIDVFCAAAYLLLLLMTLGRTIGVMPDDGSVPELPPLGGAFVAAGAIVTAVLLAGMHRRGYARETKHPNIVAIIRAVGVYTVAYAAALALGI
jgi:1,4-dihydroxy-2-naphthoate octaprenyltransferase